MISFANNASPNRDDHVLPIRCGGVTRCPPFVLRGFVRPLAIAFCVAPQSDERAGEVRLAVRPSRGLGGSRRGRCQGESFAPVD